MPGSTARTTSGWSSRPPARPARPKRVLLSRAAVLASVAATERRLGGAGPLAARAAAVVRRRGAGDLPLAGRRARAGDSSGRRPTERDAWFISLVPTQLHRLLDSADDVAALRTAHTVLLGGGPIDAGSARRADGRGPAGGRDVRLRGDRRRLRLRRHAARRGGRRDRHRGPDPDRRADALRRVRRRPGADRGVPWSTAGSSPPTPAASTRTAGCTVLGRIDDMVVSGGVNVPAPGGGRPAPRAPGHRGGRGARRRRPGVGQPGGRVRRGRPGRRPRASCATGSPRSTRGPGRRARSSCVDEIPLLDNGKPDRLALRGLGVIQVFSIPMRTRFRGITVREGVLLRGDAGWGEWSPFLEYDAAVAAPVAALRRGGGRRRLAGAGARRGAGQRDRARRRPRAGARDRARGRLPHRQGQGRRARADPRPTTRPGSRRSATRSARDGRIRIDANGAWDVDDAVAAIAALDRAAGGLEYVEQPCAAVEDLAAVRRRVEVPIAADESIRRADDPYRVRDLEAADIAVLKVQPLGGVRACLRIAEDIGLPVVVSSALETSVGIAAGVALAAALPELPYACGLATVQLLTDDVVVEPLLPVDGVLPVRRPAVDEAALVRLAAPPDRVAHWEARLAERAEGSGRRDRRPSLARAVRACAARVGRHRDRDRARLPQRTAVVRGVRRRGRRAAPAAHPDRRAHRRLPRARADQGRRPGRGDLHVRHRRRQPAPGGARGRPRRPPAGRRHRRPAGPAARHRRQPDHRPGRHLRSARPHPRPGRDRRAAGSQPDRSDPPQRAARRPAGARGQLGRPPSRRRSGRQRCRARRDCGPPTSPPGPRTVVVAGDDAGPPARMLAEGGELAAARRAQQRLAHRHEHASGATGCCSTASSGGDIERVVVFGHPTLSRPVTRLLDRDDVEVLATSGPGRVAASVRSACTPIDGADRRSRTTRPGSSAGVRPTARSPGSSTRCSPPSRTLTPYDVAGAVSRALPAEGLLVRRRLQPDPRPGPDGAAPTTVGERRKVIANRGLSGIDGTVSHRDRRRARPPHSSRALALMGDVTFLHDSNGLVLGPRRAAART